MRGSFKLVAIVSRTNIVRNRSTTCWACCMICSKKVSSVAIFNKLALSPALGPASLRRLETPTGEELNRENAMCFSFYNWLQLLSLTLVHLILDWDFANELYVVIGVANALKRVSGPWQVEEPSSMLVMYHSVLIPHSNQRLASCSLFRTCTIG